MVGGDDERPQDLKSSLRLLVSRRLPPVREPTDPQLEVELHTLVESNSRIFVNVPSTQCTPITVLFSLSFLLLSTTTRTHYFSSEAVSFRAETRHSISALQKKFGVPKEKRYFYSGKHKRDYLDPQGDS